MSALRSFPCVLFLALCLGCAGGAPGGRQQPTAPPPAEESAFSPPTLGGFSYTPQAGDTMWSLAQRFYGDGRLWKVIYAANKGKLSHSTFLRAGTELWIPPKPEGRTP